MAIAFVRNRPISKAKGESAGNLFAYINRVDGWAAKANLDETVIPYNSKPPAGFDNMQQVFKDADTYERSNGVVAKELTIAVPRELNIDEAREMMFKICQRYEETRYLSAVIHYNDHNPHIHLLLLERQRDDIDRPKEQFFKRHNSKNPEGTGAQKFPNAAKDRRAFLDNARDIIETETNKILARKDLELISFDTKNDDTMLPPAPHLGAKLHKPMLRAIERKDHNAAILKHPKVQQYLARKEIKQYLDNADILKELAQDDKQELFKPIHQQAQLKQAQNINKIQQVLEAKQSAERVKQQDQQYKIQQDKQMLRQLQKEVEQAVQRAEQQRLTQQQEASRIQRQKEEEQAALLEQQEAQAIANNERLLREELERQKQDEQTAAQAPTTDEKAKDLEQVHADNLNAWGKVLGANNAASNSFKEYQKLTGVELEKQEYSNNETNKQTNEQTNRQSSPKL